MKMTNQQNTRIPFIIRVAKILATAYVVYRIGGCIIQ